MLDLIHVSVLCTQERVKREAEPVASHASVALQLLLFFGRQYAGGSRVNKVELKQSWGCVSRDFARERIESHTFLWQPPKSSNEKGISIKAAVAEVPASMKFKNRNTVALQGETT